MLDSTDDINRYYQRMRKRKHFRWYCIDESAWYQYILINLRPRRTASSYVLVALQPPQVFNLAAHIYILSKKENNNNNNNENLQILQLVVTDTRLSREHVLTKFAPRIYVLLTKYVKVFTQPIRLKSL